MVTSIKSVISISPPGFGEGVVVSYQSRPISPGLATRAKGYLAREKWLRNNSGCGCFFRGWRRERGGEMYLYWRLAEGVKGVTTRPPIEPK